jgi:hypothetical protein
MTRGAKGQLTVQTRGQREENVAGERGSLARNKAEK